MRLRVCTFGYEYDRGRWTPTDGTERFITDDGALGWLGLGLWIPYKRLPNFLTAAEAAAEKVQARQSFDRRA